MSWAQGALRLARRAGRAALPRLGVEVVRVEPSTYTLSRAPRRHKVLRVGPDARVVLPRRPRLTYRRLSQGSYLLAERKREVEVTGLDEGTFLVQDRKRGRVRSVEVAGGHRLLLESGRDLSIRNVGAGTTVLTDPRVLRKQRLGTLQHRRQERAVGEAMGVEHLLGLLRLYRVDCVLDVGANEGQFAQRIRAGGYRGPIVSFEPLPDVFAKLEQAASADDRWVPRNHALGRESTTTTIHRSARYTGMSSLLPASEYGAKARGLQETIPVEIQVRRLDEVLDEVLAAVRPTGERARIFLKMDTQGYDLQVFGGLGDRVRDVVALQSELAFVPMYEGMPTFCEALDVYGSAGFEVSALYPVRRQLRTARLVECDCLMVRGAAVR